MALLPDVQRQELMAGKLLESSVDGDDEVEVPAQSGFPEANYSKSTSLLIPSPNDSSLALLHEHTALRNPSFFETPQKQAGSFDNCHSEIGTYHSSLCGRSYSNAEIGAKPQVSISKNLKFGNTSIRQVIPGNVSPFKDVNRTPSRVLQNSKLRENQSDKLSPEIERNRFLDQLENGSPYFSTFTANPITTPSSNRGLFRYSSEDLQPSVTSKRVLPERDDKWQLAPSNDLMDISWR